MSIPPPLISEISRPFWNALREELLIIPFCTHCKQWVWYPRRFCPSCQARSIEWRPVSGRGTVYTFTVAEVPVSPDFADQAPQLLAIVELVEQIRIASSLVSVDPDDIKIGMEVAPFFDHDSLSSITLLNFQPSPTD